MNNLNAPINIVKPINLHKYDKEKHHIDFSDMKSIVQYIINHYEKFLLLILVFVIVYIIDHLTNINAAIYGATQIPIMGATTSPAKSEKKIKKKK